MHGYGDVVKLNGEYYRLSHPNEAVTLQRIGLGSDARSFRVTTSNLITMCQWHFIVHDGKPVPQDFVLPEPPKGIVIDYHIDYDRYNGIHLMEQHYAILYLLRMRELLLHQQGEQTADGMEHIPDANKFGWARIARTMIDDCLLTVNMRSQIINRRVYVGKNNNSKDLPKGFVKQDGYDLYLQKEEGLEAANTYRFLTD